jgi:hypothetical protein
MCATDSWGTHESFMHPIFVLKNGCDTSSQESSSSEQTKVLNELHKESSVSKDVQHQTLTERASLGEKHSRVSR